MDMQQREQPMQPRELVERYKQYVRANPAQGMVGMKVDDISYAKLGFCKLFCLV